MDETIKQSRWISNYKKILSHNAVHACFPSRRQAVDFGSFKLKISFESKVITLLDDQPIRIY